MSLKASLDTIKASLKSLRAKFLEAADTNDLKATEETTLEEYSELFKEVGSNEWIYPEDWIDVHKVMEEDTYDSTKFTFGRAILLLLNDSETTTFTLRALSTTSGYGQPSAIKTSDGAYYDYDTNGSSVTHTWQPSEDKTHYVIYYYGTMKYNRNICVNRNYIPKNILYMYCDVKGFTFNSEYDCRVSSYPYFQGLECTPESTFTSKGSSGNSFSYCPFQYVNMPADFNNAWQEQSFLLNYAKNIKYCKFKNLHPSLSYSIRSSYIDFDDFDWSLYTGTAIAYDDFMAITVKGVIDLSGYTSDSEITIGNYGSAGAGNWQIKLPNAPVKIYLEWTGALSLKQSFWMYLAEHAPVVEGRTLKIDNWCSYAYLYGIQAKINGLTPYELLVSKGWIITCSYGKF